MPVKTYQRHWLMRIWFLGHSSHKCVRSRVESVSGPKMWIVMCIQKSCRVTIRFYFVSRAHALPKMTKCICSAET